MTFPHQSKPQKYSNHEHRGRGHGRGHGRENREFEERSWSGDRSDESQGLRVIETKTTQDSLKICLCEGNIQDASADVIVNTISEDMDLKRGAVSNALLQAAGHQLQSEVKRAAKSYKLNYGEIVITDGYKLKCSRVFHVVCPFWRNGSEEMVLNQIIRNCLKNAETQGLSSVVFPAIGTGNLGFPKDLVAKNMLTEVQQFNTTNLRKVTFVVHPSDQESVQNFTSFLRRGIQSAITKETHRYVKPNKAAQTTGFHGKVSSPSLGVHSMKLGQVTLEVSSGDITKETTDAIVNSSNQTFSLKAGVSKAILEAAGGQVEYECSQIVASSSKQLSKIVTSSGRLPCGHIIHISGFSNLPTVKEVVLSVLKLCESRQFTSVAFPALGTGQGGAKSGDVADVMVDAVVDFVKKKPVHVKLVKFLIFQANMVTDFHQSMVRRSGENVEEEKGIFTKLKDLFWGESSPTSEEFVIVGEDIEPAVFQLCGETSQDLREAKEMVNNLIIREHLTIPIHDPVIAHFTREDVEMLNAMQKELTVSVKLEQKGQDSVVTLEGLTRDVHKAESQIRNMIRKVERNETRRREAFIISSVVKWQYQDNVQGFENLDMLTNYDLEQAFRDQKPSVRIKINNDEYEADLVHKEAKRRGMRIKLKRVDLQDAAESAPQSSLPSHWENMKGKSVVLVKLKAGSQEYAEVEKEFRRTGLTFKIIEIERVQNSTLWRNYMIKKEELEVKNKHKNNERSLFHGTGPDTTDQINNQGFNRSFAGMHGAMYGKGSYFAVDPSYSAQGYSKPDAKGHKRMYLAKVLVGDFTRGNSGLLVPPAKSSSNADLYNSVTNDVNNPTMFVIFHDVQAYPEYLITFQ